MPRLLELCCGENQSISTVARELGWDCVSLDWNKKTNPTICCDVREFDPAEHGRFDLAWASPDCREISQNRQAKPGDVEFSDSVSKKCVELLCWYRDHQGARCWLENPQ